MPISETIFATDLTIMWFVDMMKATAALAMIKTVGYAQVWHAIVTRVELTCVLVNTISTNDN